MLEPDCQNEKLCRVCHGVDQVESRLISPCKCNGSMKFVHEKCLLAWLTSTGQFNSKCEICSETFRFEKVYSVKDEKRSISWEIARGFLNQTQTFVKLFIYNFLPVVTWWWFRTSWCLIFTSDPICIRNPPTRMEMLSIFGTGIVQLATVSVWIYFLHLVIDKIYMEIMLARRFYLLFAMRKRLADKAARWAELEESCIKAERQNFAFADFESFRVEWEYEKEYIKQEAALAMAQVPPPPQYPENLDEDYQAMAFDCDVYFFTNALEQLRTVQELGGGHLVADFMEHYTAWQKKVTSTRAFYVDRVRKLKMQEEQRHAEMKKQVDRRMKQLAKKKAAAGAGAAAVAGSDGGGAQPSDNASGLAQEQKQKGENEVPAAEPVILKVPKKPEVEPHWLMSFETIIGIHVALLVVGVVFVTLPAGAGRIILYIPSLGRPVDLFLQNTAIVTTTFIQEFTFGALILLEILPTQVPALISGHDVARFLYATLRRGVEYFLGYSVYTFLSSVTLTLRVLQLQSFGRLDGPLEEIIQQFARYFAFVRAKIFVKSTLGLALYALLIPNILVCMLIWLDNSSQSCARDIGRGGDGGTCWNPHVAVAYHAITRCIFYFMSTGLFAYALHACDEMQQMIGFRIHYTSPWVMIDQKSPPISFRKFCWSYAILMSVTLMLFVALIGVPFIAAQTLLPVFRHLAGNSDPLGKILQWLFMLVFMRCIVRKMINSFTAAWFSVWVCEIVLDSAVVPDMEDEDEDEDEDGTTTTASPEGTGAGSANSAVVNPPPPAGHGQLNVMMMAQARAMVCRLCVFIFKSDMLSVLAVFVAGTCMLTLLSTALLVQPLMLAPIFLRLCKPSDVLSSSVWVFLYYPSGLIASWAIAYSARFLALELVRSGASIVGAARVVSRAGVLAGKFVGQVLVWLGLAALMVGTLLHELVLSPMGYGPLATPVERSLGDQLNAIVWRDGFLLTSLILMCAGIAHNSVLYMNIDTVNSMLTVKHAMSTQLPLLLQVLEFAVAPGLVRLAPPTLIPQQYAWVMRYAYHAYAAVRASVLVVQYAWVFLCVRYNDIVDAKYLVGKQLMNSDERSAF